MPREKPWTILPVLKPTQAVWFVYLMWFIILCDPQWWLADLTFGAVVRIPTLLFALMLVMVFMKQPRSWFPALLAFMVYTLVLIPLAYNRGYAIGVAKFLLAFYVLALASLSFLRNVRLSLPIIACSMMYSYLWWVGLGVLRGKVSWHPSLANYDGYGPLMCMGIGSCYYFGMATRAPKERLLAYLAAIGCIAGLVSSFARGAVLAGGLVMFWIWLRSKNKLATTAAGVVGMIGLVIAANTFQTRSEQGLGFFAEMMTVFDKKDATTDDRAVLWALARREFAENPLIGVGANNFGPYAASRYRAGDVGGAYDENPQRLYERQLHSTFFQLLCEYGLIGCSIFVWMLIDFLRRNAQLRQKTFVKTWAEQSGGKLDLHSLSLGLECAMLGFLSSGLFYNQIFSVHWFYTILIINTLLWYHSRPVKPRRSTQAPAPAPIAVPA